MKGRKPKHPKLKVLEGNPGKRRITEVLSEKPMDQFFRWATEYGLTPLSRQRLVIEPSEPDDPFLRFINEADNEKDN